ncbi:MAG: sulfite exporter TauE/SafE family protein [Alphaproteobacteria bacterium]|nr:sulfite exporter TauE/SafE family protein [Alphaproteobacteria bacterium]
MPDLVFPELSAVVLIAVAFAVGGAVKGVVGLGLPTISAAIMASVIDLPTAVAILIIPLIATNIWQVMQVGAVRALLLRFGVLNAAAAAGLWIGTEILFGVDPTTVQIGLGMLLIINAVVQFSHFAPRVGPVTERRWAVPVGLASGIIGGATGSQGIVIAVWLSALDLTKDQYVQGVGLSFFLTGLVWFAAIAWNGGITGETLPLSAVGLGVALVAMALGRRLRGVLPEARFRQGVFLAMALMGLNLIRRAIFN